MYILEHKFQSTLPTRGSDVDELTKKQKLQQISIHAPHEGERQAHHIRLRLQHLISIHAPHEGERRGTVWGLYVDAEFQSTLPTRGSDIPHSKNSDSISHFNPRSPRGGATPRALSAGLNFCISIHAPHEGERPDGKPLTLDRGNISIHAPHEGERRAPETELALPKMISIHAPHEGERPIGKCLYVGAGGFQSTLPTRGSD